MQMNLFENIKIFIEIVDAGSFAQAAENLQIHRPAVTKALQQLEQESGVRLLQRTTRRLYLTPEGEEFYRRSKPLLSQADDLLESFAPDRPIRGQLRVDMPIAFARFLSGSSGGGDCPQQLRRTPGYAARWSGLPAAGGGS